MLSSACLDFQDKVALSCPLVNPHSLQVERSESLRGTVLLQITFKKKKKKELVAKLRSDARLQGT